MSKRKHKTPNQLNPSKRWLLTWNMNDGNQTGASTSGDTPLDSAETPAEPLLSLAPSAGRGSLKRGGAGMAESVAEQPEGGAKVLVPPHHVTRSEYNQILWRQANYSITVYEESPQAGIVCQLGRITLALKPHRLSAMPPPELHAGDRDQQQEERAPSQLPPQLPGGRCSLFIGSARPHHLVFDYALDDAENAPNGLRTPTAHLLCLAAEIVDEPAETCLDALEHICRHHKWKLRLIRRDYNPKTGQLLVSVCLLQQALCLPNFASEPTLQKFDYAHHMQGLMHWLHGFPVPAPLDLPTAKRHDFNQLFDAVRRRHCENGDHAITVSVGLQHPCLVPTLREYQRQAVSWMLRKEGFGETVVEGEGTDRDGSLHCLWSELKLIDQTLYYNYNSGQFTRQRFTQQPSFPGGILADEMGLGKTVEVLACILAHPRSPSSTSPTGGDTVSLHTQGSVNSSRVITDAQDQDIRPTDTTNSPSVDPDPRDDSVKDPGRVDPEAVGEAVEPKSLDTEVESLDQTAPGAAQGISSCNLGVGSEFEEGRFLPEETGKDVKADGGEEEPELMDRSCVRTLDGVMMTDSWISSQETPSERSTDLCDINARPALPEQTSVRSSLEYKAPCTSSNGDEKIEQERSDIEKVESDPNIKQESSEVIVESSDTSSPYLLSATLIGPNLPISDDLNPESASLATDSAINLPSGCQEDSSSGTISHAGTLNSEARPSPDLNVPNTKSEEGDTATVVEKTGHISSTSAASVEGNSCNGASHLPIAVSPSATKEPQTTQPQLAEGAVIPSKKTKQRRTPKGPAPINSYTRVPTRGPPAFRFVCICGVREGELDLDRSLQCHKCGGWQHCRCVNYSKQALGNDRYLCPMCCVEQPAVPSGATLIISPTSICHQWIDEINRHICTHSLNILVYRGVKAHGFLQPRMLANHDIVITTYDTLRTELHYVDLPHSNSEKGRRLRHAKRYMAVPSPLPAVEWWRVCLDEAQMVECPTAKVAEMALRLTAVNRWCVTGTPIQRDLDNLYGLFLFLGVEPYWVKNWWDTLLYKPYLHGNQEPMETALTQVLWRSAKKDVLHQINIPAQTEQVHLLQFSPIETHFYKRKQEHCARDLLHVASRLKMDAKTRLGHLGRDTVNKLMNPLLRLRQACCHPQAVRGEFISMQQSTLTMAELLQSLTLKAKLESEEAHRQLVCALNGLAAVCIINSDPLAAIQHYRDVLHSAEEHKDRVKTDSLQRLHAMHNLHELLKLRPEGLIPTLRDGELEKQVQEIRDAYLAKAEAALQSSLDSLLSLQRKVAELQAKLSPKTPWWLDGLQCLQYLDIGEDFIDKVKDTLSTTAHVDNMSVVNHFSTLRGLQMVLLTKTEELSTAYSRLQAGMAQLNVAVTKELVAEATDCHLRPFGGKPKNRCPFCRVHALFTEYETCLFAIKQRDVLTEADPDDDDGDVAGPRLQGSWGASETERILRVLLISLRQQGGDEEVLEEGGAYLEMMDTQKREFKSMRVAWTMLCERVAAWDELKMATLRLRLREAHEPKEITTQANVIEPGELDQQKFKLLNDKVLAQTQLRKKLGQLVYLKSLASTQSSLPDGNNPEPCPICVQELGKQWTVLPCGHSFCNNCMDMMRVHRGSQSKTLRCAICRSTSSLQEISYVSTEPTNREEERTIPVKGGFSTKVEAVVRTLLQLRDEDPNVKAIVFSTWVDVLTIIAKALRDNNIEFRSIGPPGDRHFKVNLMDFKQEEGVTALLLPVHSGSKGLNIIEATHVLLTEPILNPASELQAIGRVHRIGQTRPTVVHRFFVRDTIEERLHAYLQAHHTSDSLNSLEGETGALTLENLKELFTDESVEPDSAAPGGCNLPNDEYV